MGESACLTHAFSYASGIPNENNQGNPLHALGDSVSFGRFMSESLAWEKWSTFSQNRHVEEAVRYAQPGSVAQKKAFFEAHYKRIAAAKKAAALLEQENAVCKTPEMEEIEGDVCTETTHDSQATRVNSQVNVADEQQEVKPQKNEGFMANSDGGKSIAKPLELGICKVGGADPVTEREALGEISLLNQLENAEDQKMEKPLLKSSSRNQDGSRSVSKKKPGISSQKSSVCRKVPSSPEKSIAPPLHPRKENIFTPATIKSIIESTDKRRSTPKSLGKLINFTPAKGLDKLTTPVIKKTESSRVAYTSYKVSRDCTTPMKTPTMTSVSGVPRHPTTTPCSENKRTNMSVDPPSASGSRTTGPKWHLLSSVCSKSLSACRKKLQSSTLSTPFTLRTEERAARRKQKLEEKFNEKEAQKVQMQAKFKEKAETEVRKLRQTLCFRARPLPDFYKERETSKNQTKKIPQSTKLGRKPNSSTLQGTNPLPISLAKSNASKNLSLHHYHK